MKNVLFVLLSLIVLSNEMFAQQRFELKFNKNGKFKIVQFTDLHINPSNLNSDDAIANMEAVLDVEQPDLVVFTGDMIWGKPADVAFRSALRPTVDRGIPFCITFGNHDDERGLSRAELFDLASKYEEFVFSSKHLKNIPGVGNSVIEVSGSDTKKVKRLLYCVDSHAYMKGGYDYIKPEQVGWFEEQGAYYRKKNKGTAISSLAFFHIPLPEYTDARMRKGAKMFGLQKEKECPSVINSGMFAAMLADGGVDGVFVGHDHNNDYIVDWYGIALAYGRFTGGKTVYFGLDQNGARVIELTEDKKGFESWIRLRDGSQQQRVVYPDSF